MTLVLPHPAHRETGGLLLLMPWEHLSMSPFPPPSIGSAFGGRSGRLALHHAAEGCMPEGHLSFSLTTNHPPEAALCPAAGLLTPALSHSLRGFIRGPRMRHRKRHWKRKLEARQESFPWTACTEISKPWCRLPGLCQAVQQLSCSQVELSHKLL